MIPTVFTAAFFALSSGLTSAAPVVTLPPLRYDFNALEPIIEEKIMQLHHDKHHQALITALNAAEQDIEQVTGVDDQSVFKRAKLSAAIKFNGGGHINHAQFWTIMDPPAVGGTNAHGVGGKLVGGKLEQAINATFGSTDQFIASFNNITNAVQGSGWGWLGYEKATKQLRLETTAGQDPLVDLIPIIGIDVFEHSYYLQYLNERITYLQKIWNVINWNEAETRFVAALQQS